MTRNLLVSLAIVFAVQAAARSQAYMVYHERSIISSGCGSITYLNHIQPAPADSVIIGFKVQNQFNATHAAVYYTTDGSNPSGSFGQPTGTTEVVACMFGCTAGGYTIITGTVPALPAGTVVKYIFSVWNSSYEVFGNSKVCTGCVPLLTSTNATQFTYSVQGVLPIAFINFTGKEGTNLVRLFWASAQESNMDRYEVYRSRNSLVFEKAGTVMAAGNTAQRTDYFFDDLQPAEGNNYYKVTAFDKTGKYVSTSIIRILYGKNDNSVVVFVNPAGNIVNIRVVDIIKGEYAIRVFDNSGKLVYNGKVQHNGADGIYPVQLPKPLAKGNYRLVLINKYQFFQSSFMIQ
jgi:hypothetical protein